MQWKKKTARKIQIFWIGLDHKTPNPQNITSRITADSSAPVTTCAGECWFNLILAQANAGSSNIVRTPAVP